MLRITDSNTMYWKQTAATTASATIFATSTVALAILLSSHFPLGTVGFYCVQSAEVSAFVAFAISLIIFRKKIRKPRAHELIQETRVQPPTYLINIKSQPVIFQEIERPPKLPEPPANEKQLVEGLGKSGELVEPIAPPSIQEKKNEALKSFSTLKVLIEKFYKAFLQSETPLASNLSENKKVKELDKHLKGLETIVSKILMDPNLLVRFSFIRLSSMVNFDRLKESLSELDSNKVIQSLPTIFDYEDPLLKPIFDELLESLRDSKFSPPVTKSLETLRKLTSKRDPSDTKSEETPEEKATIEKELAACLDLLFRDANFEKEKVKKWSDSLFLPLVEFVSSEKKTIAKALQEVQEQFGGQGAQKKGAVKKMTAKQENFPFIAKLANSLITSPLVIGLIKHQIAYPFVNRAIDSKYFPCFAEELKKAIKGLIDLLVKPLFISIFSKDELLCSSSRDFFKFFFPETNLDQLVN